MPTAVVLLNCIGNGPFGRTTPLTPPTATAAATAIVRCVPRPRPPHPKTTTRAAEDKMTNGRS